MNRVVNRTAADRRPGETSAPRLHIAGSDADATSASEVPEQPVPHRERRCTKPPPRCGHARNWRHREKKQATRRQRALGKMTVRERVDALLDDGSFVEIGLLARHRAAGSVWNAAVPTPTAS